MDVNEENVKQKKVEVSETEMSLNGHFKELRNRLVVILAVVGVFFFISLANSESIMIYFVGLGEKCGYKFVYISPQELLLEYISLSFEISLFISLPIVVWQIWAFVKPGIRKKNRLAFLSSLFWGLLFWTLGMVFVYNVVAPIILAFLAQTEITGRIQAQISIHNYMSFLLLIFLVFGSLFEIPLLSVVLTRLGLLKSEWLKRVQKYAIIVCFVVAAVITPPDAMSQIIVAIPMLLLFHFGVLLSILTEKMKCKKR